MALEHYKRSLQEKYHDFSVANSGLVLNPEWPHLGASPDGFINCGCYGKGVLGIKCPYCHRFDEVENVASDKQSCLIQEADGSLHLDQSHSYYYQIQTQAFICQVEYCDFCVCTFPREGQPSLHIERIFADATFWNSRVESSKHFFQVCLLPELLGKWYSRPSIPRGKSWSDQLQEHENTGSTNTLFCYCQKPKDTTVEWIGCDNPYCPIEWFHLKYLGISSVPRSKWYCPDCRKLPGFNKNRKRKMVDTAEV